MFQWLNRDPIKKLEKEYAEQLVLARDVQRNGDIRRYSQMMAEAEELRSRIDQMLKEREADESASGVGK